jgi:hypothetical protein
LADVLVMQIDSLGARPMSKDEEYRGLAASCIQLAKASRRLDQKARLLAMAEAWLNLAERASRLAMNHARRVAEHPLVRKTYGRFSGAEIE